METLLEYLNDHYQQTRFSEVNFDSIEDLRDEIGDGEVNDIIDDYSKYQIKLKNYENNGRIEI